MIRPEHGASTHVGRVRHGNEDAFIAIDGLYVVADGMGGHSAGEVASAIAVKTIEEIYRSTQPGMTTPERVAEAIATANTAIFLESLDDAEKSGIGKTLTALVVTDPAAHRIVIANIGDSRTYLWRDDELKQITVDHSHVQTLVERGAISAAEARTHYQRNIVLRALGIDTSIEIDLFPLDVRDGDRFILCSDGLVDEAEDADIESEIRLKARPQELADSLVNLANDHGGRDNITVVVVDFAVISSPTTPSSNSKESPAQSPSSTSDAVIAPTSDDSPTTGRTWRPTSIALIGSVVAVVAMIVTLVIAL